MNFSTANAAFHLFAISAGVWDTGTEVWLSPVYRLFTGQRNLQFNGLAVGAAYVTLLPSGTGNGQELPSLFFNQFPVEIPATLYQILESSGGDAELRIFMSMRNTHSTENITSPIRMWFTLLCF